MRFGYIKRVSGVYLTDNERILPFQAPRIEYMRKLIDDLNKLPGLCNAQYPEIYDKLQLITNENKYYKEEEVVAKLKEYFR